MMKKVMLILSCLFFSIGLIFSQATAVKGIVVDDTGLEVVGASVVVKGTTLGVATDIDGKFSLNVPSNSTLVFSLVGMKKIEIKASPNMNVVMEHDAAMLDEVMVVAYGTAKKSAFTGSAAMVGANKLEKRSVSNISNALSGQVAGVQVSNVDGGQPGKSATIRIRGIGSMSASSNPLYIVDGIPFDGNISSINPVDVESMSVLKDAAANAIYGARGANGVVLITTKKGAIGEAKITVDMKWGSNSRAIPNYDVMTSPAMYYETFYRGLYNSKAYGGASAAVAHAYASANLFGIQNKGLGYQMYTVPQGENFIGADFKVNPNAKLGYSDGTYYYTPDDWYNEIFDKGNLRQEYNVSISGASNNINYYMSAGYLNDSGIIPGSGFDRFTGRGKIDAQVRKWLKVGTNLAYTNYKLKSPGSQTNWGSSGNLFYAANNIAPIYPLYVRDADGSIKRDHRGGIVYDYGTSTNSTRPYLRQSNPIGSLTYDKFNTDADVINTKWFAIFTPIEGLQITTNIGVNVDNKRANNLYNLYYGSSVSSDGAVSIEQNREIGLNQQYLVSYNRTVNKVHNFDLLAGFETYQLTLQDINIESSQLYNPEVGEAGNAHKATPLANSNTDKYVTQGFLSRLQYDYSGKYFLSASYRRDASSRFYKDNRWGNFGSVGGAWLLYKEEFFTADWVNMLKLKASYGIQGNDNLQYNGSDITNYYPYANQFKVSLSGGDYAPTRYYQGNKDITWETSYAFNVGADFELFNQRLNGTIEYFSRKTEDLLYYRPMSPSQGYSVMPMNVGTIVNKGVEVDLNAVAFRNKDIEVSVFVNATHVNNKITDLEASIRETGIKKSNVIYTVGGSLYDSYLPRYAGVNDESGMAEYYVDPDNGDWSITNDYTKAKQSNLGSTLPDVYGGFGFQVNAYGFDLSTQMAYQLGGRLYDGSYEALMHAGDNSGYNWHKDILNAWTPENKYSNVPRISTTDNSYQKQSNRFLVSSDYLSLNSVVLGYTFPKSLARKMMISNLRIFVSGDNLALLSTRKGFDPRTAIGLGSSTTSGSFKYSSLRTISGGINLIF